MVTKRQMLDKFKVVDLKEIAKEKGIELSGKKADLVDRLSEKLTKDEIFGLKAKLTTLKVPFNIVDHKLVPKHELLKPEEEEEVLRRYNCTKDQLPKIKYTDPVAKVLKARPGNIIKITRESPTAGTSVYYRLVVS